MSSALSHRENGKEAIFYELGEYREDILPVPKAGAGSGHGQETNFEIPETCPACHAYERLAAQNRQGRFGKSLYENRITTGTRIDGQCIRLSTIEKYCGTGNMSLFRQAMKDKKKFSTYRFDFCGYDGTLWCEPRENGDMAAGFSKEFRNCGNGYYYLLINDEYMIGYDID